MRKQTREWIHMIQKNQLENDKIILPAVALWYHHMYHRMKVLVLLMNGSDLE